MDKNTLVITVSQNKETADFILGRKVAREHGATIHMTLAHGKD